MSMGAIQYLNSYYMGQQLQQEDDFVSKCMFHLSSAAERLISKNEDGQERFLTSSVLREESIATEKTADKQNIYEHMTEEAALQCIQRALLLLKTHLDTFKRRYVVVYFTMRSFRSLLLSISYNIRGRLSALFIYFDDPKKFGYINPVHLAAQYSRTSTHTTCSNNAHFE